ncbi:hypothetical protein BGM09_28310 [Streptomyces sp. CBMA29]|nr:hypothetical protein [Streptomyces sp. CBMA29]
MVFTAAWWACEPGPWAVERVPARGFTLSACADTSPAGLFPPPAAAGSALVAESHITGAGEFTSRRPAPSVTVRFPPASVAAVTPLLVDTLCTRSDSPGSKAASADLTTSVSSTPPFSEAVNSRSTSFNTFAYVAFAPDNAGIGNAVGHVSDRFLPSTVIDTNGPEPPPDSTRSVSAATGTTLPSAPS